MGREGWGRFSYFVPHHGCAHQVNARVVGPLDVVQIRALDGGVSAVEDLESIADQADLDAPVVSALGPVGVRLVARVGVQARGDVEERALRDRVLVVVAVVEGEDLPPQTAVARRVVPACGLAVKDCLSQGEPAWFVVGGIGVAGFGGCHGRHAPEGLVVVTQRFGLVSGLVVHVCTSLVHQGLGCDLVVFGVARVVPVIDKGAEHGSGFPPVVRVSEQTRDAVCCVSVVVRYHLEGGCARGRLD